jgi:hypothetical protein
MKHLLLTALLLTVLPLQKTTAQTFTIIDTLPDGAYGNAAWGDFDNDGFKDLCYISQVLPDAACLVYHNVNNVFTQVAQQFPLLYNAGVEWGDLNNDGFDDLVANGMDSAFVSRTFIYTSNGNGTFNPIPNSIPGLSAGAVAIGDYNNDTWNDIAVTGFDNVGVEHAYIFRNNGGFGFSDINASLFGVHFGELKWGDYNNDSLPDLVINGIGSFDFRTRVYENMGADSFALQTFYMKGSGGTVDWTDLDGDGWLDILVTGYDSTSANNFTEVHHNNQDGTFSLVSTNLPEFGEPSSVAIADYNLDGALDICFNGGSAQFPSSSSALSLNTALWAYNSSAFFNGNPTNAIIDEADIDGDGDYDLVFNNYIIRNDLITTNAEAIEKAGAVSVYPNPAIDKVYIESAAEITSIHLYDSQGREIKSFNETTFMKKISLNGIEPGTYFFRTELRNGSHSFHKIIVAH